MQNKKLSRKNFIANTAKASIATGLSLTFLSSCISNKKTVGTSINTKPWEPDYTQQPLPYAYKDLEPYIDATTMELHYSKHAAAYAKNFNDAYKEEYKSAGLRDFNNLQLIVNNYSTKFRNNAGGHYNHELFWKCMTPKSTPLQQGKFLTAITDSFESFEKFKLQFADAAKNKFGSGWAWLIISKKDKKLTITTTSNQDNPLMPFAEINGYPILCLDIWEHAYYLKYQNKRVDYIANWWNIVN